jgi:DNA-binding MarR family transcriptional regulator
MENSDRCDQIHDTWNVLANTYRLINKLWNKELNQSGFTREQSLNLSIIKYLGENAAPCRISRFQVQEHSTISDLINRMMRRGLLNKFRISEGKSRVKVRLTELGEEAYLKSLKKDSLVKILSVLSQEEINQLRLLLEKIRDEALKDFEKDRNWPEIRLPPSQWNKSNLLKIPLNHRANINSKNKIANNTLKRRGRPRKNNINL